MTRTPFVALALLASAATPALAGASHWHIVLDHSTNKCAAMSTPADGKIMTNVGKKMYKSEAATQAAMAKMKECNA